MLTEVISRFQMSNTNDFFVSVFVCWFVCLFVCFLGVFFCTQGQLPYPLHTLGKAMPQYWFEILDVLVERRRSSSVDQETTPFLLIILMAIMSLTGMFT